MDGAPGPSRRGGGECLDHRPDITIDRCRDGFGIDDAEAERLGLTKLVGEALRSKLRRAAEGSTGRRGRPRRTDKPWEELGIPERTWRDRQARQRKAEQKALVDRVATDSQVRRKTDPTEPDIVIYNRVEFPADASADLTFYGAMEELPDLTPPAAESTSIPAWALRTAEARRLAALAQRLEMVFNGTFDTQHPGVWWGLPPGLILDERDAAQFEEFAAAACRGMERQEYITEARVNAAARTRPADGPPPPLAADPTAPAPADGDVNRPPRVSQDIWDAVPQDLREEANQYAAWHFRAGHRPDRAMVLGVEQARRTRALVAAVAAIRPDLDPCDIANPSRPFPEWWKMATAVAVVEVIDHMERCDATIEEDSVTRRSTRKEFIRRVRLEAHSNSLFHADRNAIVAQVEQLIDEDDGVVQNDPYHVALKIWRNLRAQKSMEE